LMYECCLHTLRIYLMRLGWIGEQAEVVCEPVPGVASRLKCRGQVTESTRTVTYEVSIKEIGYRPEPYAIADARMDADGRALVEITDMSLRLSGLSRAKIRAIWQRAATYGALLPCGGGLGWGVGRTDATSPTTPALPHKWGGSKRALFDKDSILAFAVGKP